MLRYNFQVFIPSLNRNVVFRELSVREVININKSIMNNDPAEVVLCFNRVVEECCEEKDVELTLLDKVIALLTIRSYAMSNFCKITITDHTTKTDFEHVLEVNTLIDNLKKLNVEHYRVLKIGDRITIKYGIPINPIFGDTIQVADYIHTVSDGDKIYLKWGSTLEDRTAFVDAIDMEMFREIVEYSRHLNDAFSSKPLYTILSPNDPTRILVNQFMSLNFSLYDLLKMLYTENLHNLYRAIYNFNQNLHIAPQYVEGITVAEKDLLWSYFLQDEQEKERKKQMNPTPKGTPFAP